MKQIMINAKEPNAKENEKEIIAGVSLSLSLNATLFDFNILPKQRDKRTNANQTFRMRQIKTNVKKNKCKRKWKRDNRWDKPLFIFECHRI